MATIFRCSRSSWTPSVLLDERARLLHGAKGADLSLHRDAILEFAEERGWHAEIQSNSITFWDTTARAEQ
jgi:hypothetical protein